MAHCDVKPDNLVLMPDLTLSLIDFGSADILSAKIQRWVSTVNYAPPEVLQGGRYFQRIAPAFSAGPVDSFNLGVTFFIIMFQNAPFGISVDQPHHERDYLYSQLFNEEADKFY